MKSLCLRDRARARLAHVLCIWLACLTYLCIFPSFYFFFFLFSIIFSFPIFSEDFFLIRFLLYGCCFNNFLLPFLVRFFFFFYQLLAISSMLLKKNCEFFANYLFISISKFKKKTNWNHFIAKLSWTRIGLLLDARSTHKTFKKKKYWNFFFFLTKKKIN